MTADPGLSDDASQGRAPEPLPVVHFVTGGGTGSTRVALDLALSQMRDPDLAPYLLLRSKGKPLPPTMLEAIAAAGLPHSWIPNLFPRARVIRAIVDRCAELRPAVFFAHGYSEHLWGRRAALRAGIPVIVHVEHNEERYLPWRRATAKRLARDTTATVCVSSGVQDSVLRLGIGSRRVEVIHNGTDTLRFQCRVPSEERPPDIVMAARFASSKDHATLLRAVRILADRGWEGRLRLAGGGKRTHRFRCERLAKELGIADRVDFLGATDDLPDLYARARVVVLSSRREGFGLVLVEAMAAGCAVVASRIPGIVDVVREGENGWLFPVGDASAAANSLEEALIPGAEVSRRIDAGHQAAERVFSVEAMTQRYRSLLDSVLERP